jgi:murein DD-endopeptidase MepM/ murein hydrolase activator NlpD
MSIVRRRASVVLAPVLLALLVAQGGWSRPALGEEPDVNGAITQQEQMEARLAAQRSQLSYLRRQQAWLTLSISELTTDLNHVGLEIDAAAAKLERVANSLNRSRRDLATYRRQITNLEADLRQVAADIGQSKIDLRDREALLQEHLRVAYEQSQTSILEVLLSTDSFGQATSQLSYMLTLSDEDKALADGIRATRQRLEIREETLRDGRVTLTALRDEEAIRAAALASQQRALDAARRLLEQKKADMEALRRRQERQFAAAHSNALQTRDLIAAQKRALEGQRALVKRLKRLADRLDLAYRGRFAWPERGNFAVTQEFGRTAFSPNHTGLDMAYDVPVCGGPIYAGADGTVLADGRPNAGYGDTAIGVVIGHSQRLQTWYWHLSSEIVNVGQVVETGDLIGYEGATGMATGCHLHFQVMFDGEPVNPRNYLP